MKALLALILIVAAGCQQAMPALPDGVTCDEEAQAIILREGLPVGADVTSDEYDTAYAFGYFNTIGCDMPLPDLEDL